MPSNFMNLDECHQPRGLAAPMDLDAISTHASPKSALSVEESSEDIRAKLPPPPSLEEAMSLTSPLDEEPIESPVVDHDSFGSPDGLLDVAVSKSCIIHGELAQGSWFVTYIEEDAREGKVSKRNSASL